MKAIDGEARRRWPGGRGGRGGETVSVGAGGCVAHSPTYFPSGGIVAGGKMSFTGASILVATVIIASDLKTEMAVIGAMRGR